MSGQPESDICVIGSINIDLVVRSPRLPSAGETILGGRFATFPGGKGANQAVAATRLGARTALIGCIGSDDHGRVLQGVLQKESGLDLSRVHVRDGVPTGVALITVAEGGENTIVVAPGANAGLTVEDIREAKGIIEGSATLLVQLESPIEAVLEAMTIARAAGRTVVLNASPALKAGSERRDLLKGCDVLVVNRTEAAALAGVDPQVDPARIMLRVAESGPPTIIVTLGNQGAMFVHHGRPKRVPTVRVPALDSVGAGDAFAAALAVGWVDVAKAASRSDDEFRAVDAAAFRAAVAGALATGKRGAIPSMPTRAELDRGAAELERIGG
jgi:ribokinase